MATRRKSRKKQEEVLVDIVEARETAQDFMERNQKTIFGVLTALVVLVGGWFGYNNFYKKPRQTKAVEQMYQAQFQFERDSFALALTNPGGGYPGFLDIIDQYGATPAGNLANYYAGVSYLNLGQFDAAISYLEDFKPDGEVLPIMKYGALGDAWSEKGDFEKALRFYKKAIAEEKNELLTPYYHKKAAMLNEKLGNYAEALKHYQAIKNEFPKSPDGRDIDKYIVRAQANQ